MTGALSADVCRRGSSATPSQVDGTTKAGLVVPEAREQTTRVGLVAQRLGCPARAGNFMQNVKVTSDPLEQHLHNYLGFLFVVRL